MIDKVKVLRQESGAGISLCAKALEDSGGDIEKAKKLLGVQSEECFPDIPEGIVESYIHHNRKVGVIVEVHCETEAVAHSLVKFAREICLQIAATNPEYISERDVPQERLVAERAKYAEKFIQSGKTKEEVSKLTKGKMKKFYLEHCLMNQKYVQDTRITVRDFVNNKSREMREKIRIVRFSRFQIGK